MFGMAVSASVVQAAGSGKSGVLVLDAADARAGHLRIEGSRAICQIRGRAVYRDKMT